MTLYIKIFLKYTISLHQNYKFINKLWGLINKYESYNVESTKDELIVDKMKSIINDMNKQYVNIIIIYINIFQNGKFNMILSKVSGLVAHLDRAQDS